MTFAYVDSSCLVALAFDEPRAKKLATRLQRFDRLFSSNFLEAELRSALAREGMDAEFVRITVAGYLRGADLWHLANALFLAPNTTDLSFLTRDGRQGEMARRLGFST